MGKHGKGKTSAYEHVHTHNPKARESNERKQLNIQSLAIKRFQGYVDKVRNNMVNFVPPESITKSKMDPRYELKGAARAAQEFYRPPGYEAPVPPRDLYAEYQGRMWEHEEGRKLLKAMLDLGLAQHNIGNRSRDAIRTFQETIALDPEDHLVVRHRLLRCFLDAGDGLRARELLEEMCGSSTATTSTSDQKRNTNRAAIETKVRAPDRRSCCCYNRAFIEHISLLLEEPDASANLRDSLLADAYQHNPYTLWVIAHHEVFKGVVSRTSLLCDKEVLPHVPAHSLEDALVFYEADLPLWLQTDGAVEWVQDYLHSHRLPLPSLDCAAAAQGLSSEVDEVTALSAQSNDGVQLTATDLHEIYRDMFATAFEIIRDTAMVASNQQRGKDEGKK